MQKMLKVTQLVRQFVLHKFNQGVEPVLILLGRPEPEEPLLVLETVEIFIV